MHPYLGQPPAAWRASYEEVLALKTPADLYVMTDDGTQGDEVLQRLNPASEGKVRFWRNGLDLQHAAPADAEEARRRANALGLRRTTSSSSRRPVSPAGSASTAPSTPSPCSRSSGIDARLLIVGDGEERANLEAQAASAGLAGPRHLRRRRAAGRGPALPLGRGRLPLRQRALERRQPPARSDARRPLHPHPGRGRHARPDPRRRDRRPAADRRTRRDRGTPLPSCTATRHAGSASPQRRAALRPSDFWSWEQRLDAEVDAVEALVERTPRPVAAHV